MLLTEIRAAVTAAYPETVTAANSDIATKTAVQRYSGYNPVVYVGSLELVADTYQYTKPTSMLALCTTKWWPLDDDNLSAYLNLTSDAYPPVGRQRQVSTTVINRIIRGDYFDRTSGDIAVRGGYLYVSPTPASAITIALIYSKYHVLNVGSTGYDTIPDEDLEIVRDLTMYELLKTRALEAAMTDNYAEASSKTNPRGVIADIRMAQAQLLDSVRDKYSTPVVTT